MSASRIAELEEFAGRSNGLRFEDDAQFRQFVVDSLEILEMTDREFADSLSVSRPCVNRWSNGKNLPRAATRKATVESVERRVNQKIRALRQMATRTNAAPSYSYSSPYPLAAKGR
jgi:hypothetical protein